MVEILKDYILPIIAIIVAIYIPIAIMHFQRYTNLTAMYMNNEIGQAIQAIVNFFYDDCLCDTSLINSKYNELYESKIDDNHTLHDYRRLLTMYFLELDVCRKASLYLRWRIRREYTCNEAWIIKILILMNTAVEENMIRKDISSVKEDFMPKTKGINNHLKKLYNTLSKSDSLIK